MVSRGREGARSGLLEVVAHRVRRGLRREERLALALLRGHVADAAGQQREDAGRDAEERRVERLLLLVRGLLLLRAAAAVVGRALFAAEPVRLLGVVGEFGVTAEAPRKWISTQQPKGNCSATIALDAQFFLLARVFGIKCVALCSYAPGFDPRVAYKP